MAGYQSNSGAANIYVGQSHGNLFDTKSIRAAFVSKVYSIVALQLIFTSIVIGVFTLHQPTKDYFLQSSGQGWAIGAFAITMVIYLVLICVDSARRSFPTNMILLALMTVGFSIMTGSLCARYSADQVLLAFAATAVATITIMLLAKFSPFDVTTCGCGLCVLSLIHMLATIIFLVVLVPQYAKIGQVVLAGFGALLISLYMMFDLQLIMGGRSIELSAEEYILGAILLYVDIITLFQHILMLLQRD